MPNNLAISGFDVRAIEHVLRDVRFDDGYRIAAVRCCETRDIQACPGSGKTTLLVAKLAILAEKWRWRDRGILVLSHTNVARQEVQERLAKLGGHRLLEYPHFIGTIQAFVDRYLALPFLRNSGLSDYRIDNQFFGERAEHLIANSPAFRTAYSYLSNKPNLSVKIVRGLRYEGSDLSLGCDSQDLPCGLDTPSGKQLRKLKKHLSVVERIFRYDDMFAFGERYISRKPWVSPALRRRFPWIFLDEMQDTDGLQDRLLRLAFGDSCIVQRLGDSNQAIFDSTYSKESGNTFPSDDFLQLPQSKRFGCQIASFATPLTRAVNFQSIEGQNSVASKRHTIFLFDSDSIKNVLPSFGRLLADEYSSGLPKTFRAKAIAARKRGDSSKPDHQPYAIADYYSHFDPAIPTSSVGSRIPANLPSLIDYFRYGQLMFQKTGNFSEGFRIYCQGYLETLKIHGYRRTKAELFKELRDAGDLVGFKRAAFDFLVGSTILDDPAKWHQFVGSHINILNDILGIAGWGDEARRFCEWSDKSGTVGSTKSHKTNIYVYETGTPLGNIEIELSTIHAAKGETHTATLVLDSYVDGSHDLKMVYPFLFSDRQIGGPVRKRMRRTFVAMTRPRELLCLAIRRDHFGKMKTARSKLEGQGWRIEEV